MSDLVQILYRPPMQFWFLYVLFLVFMLFGVLHRAGLSRVNILLASIVIFLLPRVTTLGNWGVLYQLCRFFIYFAVGVALSQVFLGWISRVPRKALVLLAVGGFTLLALAATWPVAFDQGLTRVVIALLGIGATVALAKWLAEQRIAGALHYLGVISMQIYVAHTIMSAGFRIMAKSLLGTNSPALHLLGGVTVGLVLPALLAWASSRFGVQVLFVMPKRSSIKSAGMDTSRPA